MRLRLLLLALCFAPPWLSAAARPPERQIAVGIEQSLDVDFVTDRLGQRARFILLELSRQRRNRRSRRT